MDNTGVETVRKAILNDKVTFDGRRRAALATFDFKNPDFTITNISVGFWGAGGKNRCNDGGPSIGYSMKAAGCGRADFYTVDGQLRCANQYMGKEFLGKLLQFMLQHTELDSEKSNDENQNNSSDTIP